MQIQSFIAGAGLFVTLVSAESPICTVFTPSDNQYFRQNLEPQQVSAGFTCPSDGDIPSNLTTGCGQCGIPLEGNVAPMTNITTSPYQYIRDYALIYPLYNVVSSAMQKVGAPAFTTGTCQNITGTGSACITRGTSAIALYSLTNSCVNGTFYGCNGTLANGTTATVCGYSSQFDGGAIFTKDITDTSSYSFNPALTLVCSGAVQTMGRAGLLLLLTGLAMLCVR